MVELQGYYSAERHVVGAVPRHHDLPMPFTKEQSAPATWPWLQPPGSTFCLWLPAPRIDAPVSRQSAVCLIFHSRLTVCTAPAAATSTAALHMLRVAARVGMCAAAHDGPQRRRLDYSCLVLRCRRRCRHQCLVPRPGSLVCPCYRSASSRLHRSLHRRMHRSAHCSRGAAGLPRTHLHRALYAAPPVRDGTIGVPQAGRRRESWTASSPLVQQRRQRGSRSESGAHSQHQRLLLPGGRCLQRRVQLHLLVQLLLQEFHLPHNQCARC